MVPPVHLSCFPSAVCISVGNSLLSYDTDPLLSHHLGIPMLSAFTGMCHFFCQLEKTVDPPKAPFFIS